MEWEKRSSAGAGRSVGDQQRPAGLTSRVVLGKSQGLGGKSREKMSYMEESCYEKFIFGLLIYSLKRVLSEDLLG